MDEATKEFLALMAGSIESSRILLCVTHRQALRSVSAKVCFTRGS